MSIRQLIASIRKYPYSGKFRRKDIQIGVLILLITLTAGVIYRLNKESHPLLTHSNISKTEETHSAYGDFPSATAVSQETIAREALTWMQVLQSYEDAALNPEQLSEKYLNLGIAATILSGTGKGNYRQQFWSAKAIRYCQMSDKIRLAMTPGPQAEILQEIRTRLLLAMALNYYSGGQTKAADLMDQFRDIDKGFLVRTGFCKNKILRQLENDKLIQLPGYEVEKWI